MYDIIGDIHGHADELRELLEQMGYAEQAGCYRHPQRQAVFVGDFVDRGSQIREVLQLVRTMHAAGTALSVMGNHEFNALAWATPNPDSPGEFLRRHSEKNFKQHRETLEQMGDDLPDFLEWFRTLPMWLDLGGLRIVHACWDPVAMELISKEYEECGGVSPEFLRRSNRQGHPLFDAIEDVLKGKEVNLPQGLFTLDKEGHPRYKLRVQWYREPREETFASYGFTDDTNLPTEALPEAVRNTIRPYPADAPPLFFGHYWLRADQPTLLGPNIACLDYSVARGGMLCAYRWQGEALLSNDHFVTVPAK